MREMRYKQGEQSLAVHSTRDRLAAAALPG